MNLKRIQLILISLAVVIVGTVIYFTLRPSADISSTPSIDFLIEEQLNAGVFENTELKDGKIQLTPQ